MATIKDKIATSATPHEVMETDLENINLSRDQFVAKYRKKAEIKAKLAAEKARLEALAEQEEKELIKAGQEDNVKNETQGTTEEV